MSTHAANLSAINPLLAANASFTLPELGILQVEGPDAATFLQGQCTCDIRQLQANQSSFGAFCNAKGRVLANFVVAYQQEAYYLILPQALLPLMQKRLSMYILRAKVQLHDCSAQYCLLGINAREPLAHNSLAVAGHIIPYPCANQHRYLLLAEHAQCSATQQQLASAGYPAGDVADWQRLDLFAKIVWLTAEQSEEFIPQMLNLDQLGGISFNKGCYTGQEIVARTHYLGKNKRNLYLAQATLPQPASGGCVVLDSDLQSMGQVLSAQWASNLSYLLLLLNNEAAALSELQLVLSNGTHIPLTIID